MLKSILCLAAAGLPVIAQELPPVELAPLADAPAVETTPSSAAPLAVSDNVITVGRVTTSAKEDIFGTPLAGRYAADFAARHSVTPTVAKADEHSEETASVSLSALIFQLEIQGYRVGREVFVNGCFLAIGDVLTVTDGVVKYRARLTAVTDEEVCFRDADGTAEAVIKLPKFNATADAVPTINLSNKNQQGDRK